MAKRLFGTDGVRGKANSELTAELALKLGRAGAFVLAERSPSKTIIIGKDTRISGDLLEAALSAGICSAGCHASLLGIVPTPAVAYLARELNASAGVVISASHNHMSDNGIKFFGGDGYKLSDEKEKEIERAVARVDTLPYPAGVNVGRIKHVPEAIEKYVNFLKKMVNVDLKGIKIVVDCAHGSAFEVTPRVLSELGAKVVATINDEPDGTNINENCGSIHPQGMQRAVVEQGADLGVAHDGDADRVLAADSEGKLVDGDQIMVACARHLQKKGELTGNKIVVTVMSNMGLHLALKEAGITVLKTKVGDRYVLEKMLESGAVLGGEQSGHIIFLKYNTTGDGLITVLQLLSVMQETGRSLKELASQMVRLPQYMVNVEVRDKKALEGNQTVWRAVRGAEKKLGEKGRILLRPSGTEPLVRVMGEGPDEKELQQVIQELAELVEKELN